MLDVGKMVDAILDAVDRPLREFHNRLRALEVIAAKMGPIEKVVWKLDAEAMRYRGVFEPGLTYHRGETVSLNGGLWLCQETSDIRPGKNGDWKLVVKSAEPKRDRDDDKD